MMNKERDILTPAAMSDPKHAELRRGIERGLRGRREKKARHT